ncbi:MAG TPA: shikimate dehydrogenase [Cytophagales bacterium]|jgi:shikimate dehydrogenase|nr:shikimate dehydrogenase [Cytophagales bacterium]
MVKKLGLIGHPLHHSFSKRYFNKKFEKNGIIGYEYDLYDIETIDHVRDVFSIPNLLGFNVTIPYKHAIQPYLDDLDFSARKVGAVNVVKLLPNGKKVGFNSDYYGFKTSLLHWIGNKKINNALVLGTGGASKAVLVALEDLKINASTVSRDKNKGAYTYVDLTQRKVIPDHQLIINTTPLGTHPKEGEAPDLPYEQLATKHFLYDLIYNPAETSFMKKGISAGAKVKNGYEMLVLQAEKSWEIWNT